MNFAQAGNFKNLIYNKIIKKILLFFLVVSALAIVQMERQSFMYQNTYKIAFWNIKTKVVV